MASDPNFDIETPRHFENDANIAKQCDRMANQSYFAAFHWILSNYHGGFSLAKKNEGNLKNRLTASMAHIV
jgi:hypothetical protein